MTLSPRHQQLDAEHLLAGFERWPTWMWANHEGRPREPELETEPTGL